MSAANPGYGTGILGSYFINDLGAGMIFKLFRAPFGQKKMPRSSTNATMLSPGLSRSSAICQGSRGIVPTHFFAIAPPPGATCAQSLCLDLGSVHPIQSTSWCAKFVPSIFASHRSPSNLSSL